MHHSTHLGGSQQPFSPEHVKLHPAVTLTSMPPTGSLFSCLRLSISPSHHIHLPPLMIDHSLQGKPFTWGCYVLRLCLWPLSHTAQWIQVYRSGSSLWRKFKRWKPHGRCKCELHVWTKCFSFKSFKYADPDLHSRLKPVESYFFLKL